VAFFDASGRVDFETLTQCIQAVVHLRECGFGKLHRVDNVVLAANLFHRGFAELSQLLIEEADVELSIVNDESGALNKFNELVGDVRKLRLTDQKFIGDLVDADNLCLHLAFRIDVLMKIFIG